MNNLKAQIEVRFTPILDYHSKFKTILSPFLRFAKFETKKINNNDVFILNFAEEKYEITCTWNSLIFHTFEPTENILEKTGNLTHFFVILEKIKKIDSFGKIIDIIYGNWYLNTIPEDDIISLYKDNYINDKINSIEGDDNYHQITINKQTNKYNFQIQITPVFNLGNLQSQGVMPKIIEDIIPIIDYKGILYNIAIVYTNYDLDSLRKINAFSEKIYNHLKIKTVEN